jgi:hypothetical protein
MQQQGVLPEKEKFTLFSDHIRSLLRRQPGADSAIMVLKGGRIPVPPVQLFLTQGKIEC